MLDWIFEGIVDWIAGIVTGLMDAVSGVFLETLGTDVDVMEQYFPFVAKAFEVFQYTGWALLFLITVWQLFRAFGGPITEAENPWQLLARSAIFALLIGYAKPVFLLLLGMARAPYMAMMDLPITAKDFSFAGVENSIKAGLVGLVAVGSVIGQILIIILLLALGWNYFKTLLEVVERYIVVGVLCYTSPLAYAMGCSKSTSQVFKSWCRMVGSQLILLVMNVWFLRGFNSSVGQFVTGGGALTGGHGNVFLWIFCALAFLKTAQKFDSILASMGLSVAQTGTGMGMDLMMAARTMTGFARGATHSAGGMFRGGSAPGSAANAGISGGLAGITSKFKGNSYVRDAVVEGGQRMGASGGIGMIGRAFGSAAAKGGATLTGDSIASVATHSPQNAGKIAGDIADRSLPNYMPHMTGQALSQTQISGGHISTTAQMPDGKQANVELYSAGQFEQPDAPHATVQASDGSQWYQMASGDGAGAFYATPQFAGDPGEAAQVAEAFPGMPEGTTLRTVDDGVLEASGSDGGISMLYSAAHFEPPDAPHDTVTGSDGMQYYQTMPHADPPQFEPAAGDASHEIAAAAAYNNAQFQNFVPAYEQPVTQVNSERANEGVLEVRHNDGSGTAFYDQAQYQAPRGEHKAYEDAKGGQWYAILGTPTVERKPLYENGKPVYDGDTLRTIQTETLRYKAVPTKIEAPKRRDMQTRKPPRRRQ
ncbi:MAG: hypothetical protein LBS96_08035 [Oscillospiraceae bacterium]|jgi:hypothetical protein|nr:hypothetical protein [Oscillospiraceae bacterium]